jgi:hypothetical protein
LSWAILHLARFWFLGFQLRRRANESDQAARFGRDHLPPAAAFARRAKAARRPFDSAQGLEPVETAPHYKNSSVVSRRIRSRTL